MKKIIKRGWSCGAILLAWMCFNGQSAADTIRLSTGETLTVEILETTGESIRFRHAVLGEVTLPRGAVEIVPASELAPAEPQATAPVTDQTPPPPAEGVPPAAEAPPEPPKEWTFKFTLAGAAATGNSESANLATIFTATRETPEIRTVLDSGFFYASSDSVTSSTRFTAGARNDWLNPESKWFYFADARYDFDDYQSWDHRATGHVGIGYRLITPPPLILNARAGIGLIKEWGSENDDIRPEGLLGLDGEWAISEKQSLKFDSTVFPDLSDVGEFRWVNNVGWSLLVDEKNKLSLTAGLQHEYQSQVDLDRKKNDLRVFAGVDWEF